MKNLHTFSIMLLSIVSLGLVATSCAKSPQTNNDPCATLPSAAKTILQKFFANKDILLVKQETEWVHRYYDVVFTDGNKIEFDSNGEWTEIDCLQSRVPEPLIPQQILAFVKKNYADSFVTQIDKDRYGYDVDLSNGFDIEFDRNLQLIDIDR